MRDQLVRELKEAAKAYYQGETPLISDKEYDDKIEYLASLVESGEIELDDEVREVLESVSAGSAPVGTVIVHDYPMLSLGKAKNAEELQKYIEKLVKSGATGFRLEMKFDGLALSAKYESGKLTQLATRGDGVKGESLTYLINHDKVKIMGLPVRVDNKESFELRGELYITDKQFEEINKERIKSSGEAFSNSRNAVTGIVKRADKGIDYPAEITFTAYSAYQLGEQVEFSSLGSLEEVYIAKDITEEEVCRLSTDELGLKSCAVHSTKVSEVSAVVETFGKLRELFGIPTDGVVIKPLNEIEMLNKMGFTAHHPIAYIAYKYPGEKAITVVKDIILSVGKTGRVTPQAQVEPVEVGGVVISNITCHNFSWINSMGIRVGAKVAVTRANDVIPAIDTVVDYGPNEAIKTPTHCPECGSVLSGDGTLFPKTLTCENESCPSRLLYYMKSIVGRNFLYIDGLGDVALVSLVKSGKLKSVVDLFNLTEAELAEIPTGFTSTGNVKKLGLGNAKNIINSIEKAKNSTESHKLLASMNVDGMGPNTAKKLIEHFEGLMNVLLVDPTRLLEVNQIGDSLVDSYAKQRSRIVDEVNQLVALGVKINDPKPVLATSGTFSVSGSVEGFANREDFVKHMESLGWEFHKAPKKDTDVLFADPESTSSKVKKARENGTRIVLRFEDL